MMKKTIALLLALVLVLSLSGCAATTGSLIDTDEVKVLVDLDAVAAPEMAGTYRVTNDFPMTAEQITALADRLYEGRGYQKKEVALGYFFSDVHDIGQSKEILHIQSKQQPLNPDGTWGGNLATDMEGIVYSWKYSEATQFFQPVYLTKHPKQGTMLTELLVVPENDAVYQHILQDSRSVLELVGYPADEVMVAGKLTPQAQAEIIDLVGGYLSEGEPVEDLYLIQYHIVPDTDEAALEQCVWTHGFFLYNAQGKLIKMAIGSRQSIETIESHPLCSIHDAYRAACAERYEVGRELYDVQYEVRKEYVAADSKGYWEFRFRYPTEPTRLQQQELAAMDEATRAKVSGVYKDYAIFVDAATGTVMRGSAWDTGTPGHNYYHCYNTAEKMK